MKIERIIIDGIELLDICEFNIHKIVNDHCRGVIAGHISDINEADYFRKSMVDDWILIKAADDNGESITLFGGYIKNMEIFTIGGQKAIRVLFESGTILLDLIKKRYTYQDETESYESIVNSVISGYSNARSICIEKSADAIENMIVQYEETDWEFLKRLASNIGHVIIPHARQEVIVFDFGLNEYVSEEKISSVLGVTRKIEKNCYCYVIKTRDYFDLGAKIIYENQPFYIYESVSMLDGQQVVNEYVLKRASDFTMQKYYNDQIIGTSLDAYVLSSERDEVTIQVIGEDDTRQKKFPYATVYSSPTGAGWYCMPEQGDRVRLYFPTNVEKDAYVINAVHMPVLSTSELGERSNPNNKSIKNKEGKELLLTPDKILITNNKGMSIEINDQEGISITSNKKIVIESLESIDMISMNKNLNLIASEEINLEQKESFINLKTDIVMSGGRIKTV